jgi:hypothetical protein
LAQTRPRATAVAGAAFALVAAALDGAVAKVQQLLELLALLGLEFNLIELSDEDCFFRFQSAVAVFLFPLTYGYEVWDLQSRVWQKLELSCRRFYSCFFS